MLICHVINGLGSGGAERMLTRIASAKRAETEQVVLSLTDDGVFGDDLRNAGVQVVALDGRRGAPSARVAARLVSQLRRYRPDVIMTWLYHADLLGTAGALAAGLSPRRVVWNLRCSNIDFRQYSPWTRRTVSALARLSRLPGVVAFNSHAGRIHHEALGYRPKQWAYLPNGLDLEGWRPLEGGRAEARAALGLAPEGPLVGMIARVDPQKDHGTFLAAAARVAQARPDVQFALIGEGTETLAPPPGLEARLRRLGERRDLPALAPLLDLHVLSSAYGEGFPNVICEAMACGAPCVATDVGDAARVIGETGLTTPTRDPEALAEAILRLLAEPEEARRARGLAARRSIHDRFDIAGVQQAYSTLFEEVADRAGHAERA